MKTATILRIVLLIAAALACASLAAACSSPGEQPAADESPAADAAPGGAAPEPEPGPAPADETAPETYRVLFDTSEGNFTVEVNRSWAPRGADRFYTLVRSGFYDGVRFFRVIRQPDPFMVQFGISGDPAVSAKWANSEIQDDPARQSNTRGMVTFATAGPNTRTTQVFINYADNSFLDSQGFSPFGRVVEGMDVVDRLYADYGEGQPRGRGPRQDLIEEQGNAYLEKEYPNLDYVETARIVE